jgi:uncharacterized protein
MNEQQNGALVQKVYDAFGRGDLQTILSCLADDIDWTTEGPEIVPFAGKRKGLAQAKGFFEALATTQTGMKLTIDRMIAQGDMVATTGRYACTVTATGKKMDSPIGHFFTIRDGKICRYVGLLDTAATAEAYRTSAAAAG